MKVSHGEAHREYEQQQQGHQQQHQPEHEFEQLHHRSEHQHQQFHQIPQVAPLPYGYPPHHHIQYMQHPSQHAAPQTIHPSPIDIHHLPHHSLGMQVYAAFSPAMTYICSPISHPGMLYPPPTATPGASGSGPGNPPICWNCHTLTTPLWRRDENGKTLCNACGLFLKLHGRNRPHSLKTDVIKSRNRVKSSGLSKRKTFEDESVASSSRETPTSTPPHSPTLQQLQPSGNSISFADQQFQPPEELVERLKAENAQLRTEMAEKDVVCDIYKSKVSELESKLDQMKVRLEGLQENDSRLRARLEQQMSIQNSQDVHIKSLKDMLAELGHQDSGTPYTHKPRNNKKRKISEKSRNGNMVENLGIAEPLG